MRVFVAGATGVAGRRAVRLFVQRGHEVTAVVRSPAKARLATSLGATPVLLDLFAPSEVTDAAKGHEVVVNLATKIPPFRKAMLPGAWSENDRIRSEVSRNLVDAALAGDALRYIQESLGFIYTDNGDAWIDESSSLDPPPHARTVLEAEAQAARFTERGGSGVVCRFGQFYASDAAHTRSMLKLARGRILPLPGPPEAFFPTIHADDVANAIVAALQAPAGIYNVVDNEPLRQRELADVLGSTLAIRALRFAPPGVIRLGGQKVEMLMRSQRVSNRRFREAAGWSPKFPSAREGFAAVVKEVDGDVDREST